MGPDGIHPARSGKPERQTRGPATLTHHPEEWSDVRIQLNLKNWREKKKEP